MYFIRSTKHVLGSVRGGEEKKRKIPGKPIQLVVIEFGERVRDRIG